MTDAPVFLALEHVLAVHQRSIQEFGGDPSIRDQGLLESAIAMPSARFGGDFLHDGVPAMAAAYLFHLCRNHPFVDGNKRTALATAEVFLLLNGWTLHATKEELLEVTLGVAASRVSKDEATAFFRKHTSG